jgi:hypothetical protein
VLVTALPHGVQEYEERDRLSPSPPERSDTP